MTTKGGHEGREDGGPVAVTAGEDGGAGTEAEWVPEGSNVGEGHAPASLVPWRKAAQRSKPLLKVVD